jgi:hypothetical protein
MAGDAITYDKAELRAIARAFKAMDEEAIAQAKESSSALADFVRGKIDAAANSVTRNRLGQSESLTVQRFPNLQRLVKSVLVLQAKIKRRRHNPTDYGAVQNLVQISISNFQCGQVVKVAVHAVGLSTQPFEAPNLKSFRNGNKRLKR